MGLTYRSDEQIERELSQTLSSPRVEKLERGGRNLGDKNLSPFIRQAVAIGTKLGSITSVAREFDVSYSHARNLGRGVVNINQRISEGSNAKQEQAVKKGIEAVHEKAVDMLLESLQSVDKAEVAALPVRARISAAKDIASIVDKTNTTKEGSPNNSFVVYAPNIMSIEEFRTA